MIRVVVAHAEQQHVIEFLGGAAQPPDEIVAERPLTLEPAELIPGALVLSALVL
jgi:hypothetical protein